MVRIYKSKTDRGKADEDQHKGAVADVDNGTSVRQASGIHGLCPMTLCHYIKSGLVRCRHLLGTAIMDKSSQKYKSSSLRHISSKMLSSISGCQLGP